MSDSGRPAAAMPADPGLRALVERAAAMTAEAAPLSAALLGAEPRLPDVSPQRVADLVLAMTELAARLEGVAALPGRDDELDRQSLAHGLRRATGAFGPRDPDGAEALEQHLQLRLLRLLDEPQRSLESLVELVEFGPEFLRRARPVELQGDTVAGQIATEAAGRLPALLDACAAAGRELAAAPLRFRLEAALGALLQAGAEESGWLLKEYLADALEQPARVPDPIQAGLGMTLAEIEATAEGALTEAVLAEPAAEPSSAPLAGLADVRRAWQDAETGAGGFGGGVAEAVEIVSAPGWLEALLPGLSLALPGPLSSSPARLLVGHQRAGTADDVALLYLCEFLPWAHQRGHHRAARMLLPAPDLGEGWRAHVRATMAAGDLPWPRELAWRAALALAALAMTERGASVDQAAGMVAAESAMAEAAARLQCLHLRRRPLGALTFIAGRTAVATAVGRVGPATVLSSGPLAAAAVGFLV